MSTLTNVFSAHLETTGTIYAGATNLAGYQILSGSVAGDIIFRDGGASGSTLLPINASATQVVFGLTLPGNGIRFTTNIHVTMPAGAKVTIFCG